MHPQEPYGPADDELGDLPPLPIPRPGAWVAATPPPPAAAPGPEPIAGPNLGGSLGGGASFTAASEDGSATHPPEVPTAPVPIDADSRAVARLPWELAARITSGMLANPARANASVKDAMGLFDQLLREMHAYARIAGDLDVATAESARRRTHGEYFHGSQERVADAGATADQPAGPARKPTPTQPRPAGDYRPIPPGSRGPYAPGTMAGTPPPADDTPPGEPGVRAA